LKTGVQPTSGRYSNWLIGCVMMRKFFDVLHSPSCVCIIVSYKFMLTDFGNGLALE